MTEAIPFADYIVAAIFALAAGTTLTGALIATMTTRVIRAVTGLMICCLGLAGLYYFLHSPFLALMEILIYVGAVCVTIIFGVMLSDPDVIGRPERRTRRLVWGGTAFVISLCLFWALVQVCTQGPWTVPATHVSDGSIPAIGLALLTTYSLPFELISVVLLVAILGALVVARSGRTKE